MEGCLLDLAKNEVQSLVNLVKNEAQNLCCFNSYVENFDQKKKILASKHRDVKRKFQKGKGVFSFKFEAQQWEHDADGIIHIDTKIKKQLFFGWCPNCWWQYRKGKELAEKTKHIEELLGRCNSNIIASRANVSSIKHLSSEDFIHFRSRESEFQDLINALRDENCNMIGLQGMGGAGKTSMAKEMGHKLKNDNLVDKLIFLVVSKPPDFKKIRGELAKGLDLNLEDVKEEELSNTICSRITSMDEKLLIILDDVWEKFDLTENLGIPSSHRHKGCSLLITTRNSHLCTEMGCQMIKLQTLTGEEALNLFLSHACINSSSRGLKGMPAKIVKHCGGVPVAIVAIAKALKNQPTLVWKDALKTLEDRGVDQNLEEAYNCLKLSYDNLKNDKAKELLLVSSLFPEDLDIPIKLITKIGLGLGSFNENGKYHLARRDVHAAIMELKDSSLLLNGEEECVKIHDLVREVALWIGGKEVQSIIELKMPIKESLRYLLVSNHDFPDEFDGNKLEVLLICLDVSKELNVSNTFFEKMTRLKVLVLGSDYHKRVSALSLTNSLQSLKDIQTLALANFKLGDISILGNLLSLQTLWLRDCSIIELPSEFFKLERLRSLEVEKCTIEKNNPFEVIERFSQLEELMFVGNKCDHEEKDAISQNRYPLILHKYCITSEDLLDNFEEYGSMSRCFRIDELSHLVSNATFQQLVGGAELLILEGEDAKRTWKNLIPDIVPIGKEGTMNDLIVLHLSSCPDMECLVDTKDHDDIGVTTFCNLVELYLSEMGVEDLCRGPQPSCFLEQLEIMKLKECHRLRSILSNGNYSLCHLKSMELEDCPKLTSVFQPSTARSLMQLEELIIRSYSALEYIIVDEEDDSNQKSCYDSLFPKLKIFQIAKCNKLRIILSILFARGLASLEKISICESEQLEYIFDKFQEGEDAILSSLKELELSKVPSFIGIFREYHQLKSSSMQKPSPPLSRHHSNKINQSPATLVFSWVQACCSLNKSRPPCKETNIVGSEHRSFDHPKPPGLAASRKWIDTTATLGRQLVLHVRHIKKMELVGFYLNSVSTLFSLSIASMISWEELTIKSYDGLKHLVRSEEDDYTDQINCSSIFPKLQKLEIWECKDLEFLFLSTISVEIKNLKSLTIKNAPNLTHVVGNYQHHHYISNQNNDDLHFELPALEVLCFEDAPKFISIGPMNYKMVSPSLQNVCSNKGQLNSNTTKELLASINGAPLFHTAQSLIQSLKNIRKMVLVKCANLISLSTLSIASTILLEDLTIRGCGQLRCIAADEGDAGTHMSYNPIFPKLKRLQVSECDSLEYLFPAYAFICPVYLEFLIIHSAPMLKYIFGRSQHEDSLTHENHDTQTRMDFPALKYLAISYVPELVGIYPKNYYLRGLSLWSIVLGGFREFTRPFNEFLACWLTKQQKTKAIDEMRPQTLKYLEVYDSKIEDIVDLTYLDTKKKQFMTSSLQLKLRDLSEIVNLFVAPKSIIGFHSLQNLFITACKKLKIIFSASTVRSLPMLKILYILSCEELVHIVEEDYETNANDHLHHEPCFPNLERVSVKDCDKLKYLFSITTFDTLPKLSQLQISEASELERVLLRRGDMKEMVVKDVLPQLSELKLIELPNIVSICHGIDFEILKESDHTEVLDCPNFSFYETSTTQLQASLEIANSQVEEKAEEKLSSHLTTNESFITKKIQEAEIVEEDCISEMAKMTIISFDSKLTGQLDELVNKEVKNEAIKMDPSPVGADENLTKKLPIHTSPNLTVLPARDNTPASAKPFEEEEEGDLFVPPVTITSTEKTSEAILPLSPMSLKASTSLNQTPSSIYPKTFDDDVQVCDESHPHSTTLFEGVDNGDIMEACMVKNKSWSNVEPSNLTQRDQELPYSKDSQPRRAMPTTPFVTISQHESSKIVEVRSKEGTSLETPRPSSLTSKKEPIPVNPNPTVFPRSLSTTAKIVEEEEKGGLITAHRHQSDMKSVSSLPVGKEHKISNLGGPFVPSISAISSELASEMILPLSLIPSKALTSPKQTSISTPSESTYGKNIKENVGTTNQHLHKAFGAIQISSDQLVECHSWDMASSIYDTNNALSVPGVKEIIGMMKLEGVEPSMLAEAFKTNPQLRLSLEDRSAELLCYSYRVLLNILNILATRSPIMITEADKRLLAKYLKDASILGFDKDWLESIKIKVFNCDVSELHCVQDFLRDLGNRLEANKIELAIIRDQEVKATQSIEMAHKELDATHKELEAAYKGLEAAHSHFNVAQQQHANIKVRHSQLLEESQKILEQRNQCLEIIAAKVRPFGF